MSLIYLAIVLVAILCVSCWGPGSHLYFASRVLEGADERLPRTVAKELAAETDAYLYGNLAADIIHIKGFGGHHNHCHRWTIVDEMLDAAEDSGERVFALGYLSHLAADTIAHNHYVPYHLARYARSRGFGHVYWEMRADRFLDDDLWSIVTRLKENTELREYDELVMRFVPKRALPDRANRLLFDHVLLVAQRDRWRRGVERLHEVSFAPLELEFLDRFREAAIERVNLALGGQVELLQHIDPTGKDAQKRASRARRMTLTSTVRSETRKRVAEEVAAPFLEGMESPPPTSGEPLWTR